jgi:AcrR family transcriptional regulator
MPKIVNHEQRRAEIAEIAAEIIAAGGLEAATMREIARRSGFSKGIIEHYFDGKSELIDAALAWANQRYFERVERATAGLVGLDALRARLKATVPSTVSLRNEWKIRLIFWSIAAIDPALQRQQALRTRDAIAHFAADLRDAQSRGELDSASLAGSVESAARQVLFAATGLSCAILHNPRAYNKNVIEAEIERIVTTSTAQVG